MKATQRLHDLGQSIWLDNITRGLLTKGTLRHYITDHPSMTDAHQAVQCCVLYAVIGHLSLYSRAA